MRFPSSRVPALIPHLPTWPARSPPPIARKEPSDKYRLGYYLRKLPKPDELQDAYEVNADEWLGCARCLRLLDEIRAADLPVPADATNAAMRVCASRIDVVERLFEGLQELDLVTEASFAALLAARLANDDLAAARAAVNGLLAKPNLRPKLRTCSPLLILLCAKDEATAAIDLWERLERRGVDFSQREYAARIRMHGRLGASAQLQHSLAKLMARVPNPDAATVAAIEEAVNFCSQSSATGKPAAIVRRGTHDDDGHCSCCGARLQVLYLDAAEREQVRDVLLARAASRSANGLEHLQRYREWLRVRPPFQYVIDGPNVAYFGQNYEAGRFQYAQIQRILDELREKDPAARVLVLIPSKYLRNTIPNHTSSSARQNELTVTDKALLQAWRQEGILYDCSGNLYDDWYWMYATVAETQAPEPPHPDAVNTRVVTNDEMRDHWHDLLPAVAFARWKHSQVAAFECDSRIREDPTSADDSGHGITLEQVQVEAVAVTALEVTSITTEAMGEVDATLTRVADPPLISLEAQLSVEGRAWHIPVPDTEPQEWLCFQLELPGAD